MTGTESQCKHKCPLSRLYRMRKRKREGRLKTKRLVYLKSILAVQKDLDDQSLQSLIKESQNFTKKGKTVPRSLIKRRVALGKKENVRGGKETKIEKSEKER